MIYQAKDCATLRLGVYKKFSNVTRMRTFPGLIFHAGSFFQILGILGFCIRAVIWLISGGDRGSAARGVVSWRGVGWI